MLTIQYSIVFMQLNFYPLLQFMLLFCVYKKIQSQIAKLPITIFKMINPIKLANKQKR